MTFVEFLGYLAAVVTLGTYSMKTMIPLRICGITANVLFIAFGFLSPVYPTLALHAVLLPLALTLRFRVTECIERGRGRWRVETTGYRYSVQDAPDHEVLRYDWHPESQEGGRLVSFPHLHVHAGRSVGRWPMSEGSRTR